MGPVQRNLLGIMMTVACCVLGACHGSGNADVTVIKHYSASSAAGGNGAQQGPADLVSAVSLNGNGDGAVSLQFQVGQRPVAGQPVNITLRLTANEPLDHLEARFHSDEGLDVTQGGDFDPDGHLDSRATLEHNLTVLPAHEGVFTVMATVTMGSETRALNHVFVIPIVVGSTH